MSRGNSTALDNFDLTAPLYRPRFYTPLAKQRFRRDRRSRLLCELPGFPTAMQEILISRIVDLEWNISRIMVQPGERGETTNKLLMAQHNHLRLCLREYANLIHREPPAPKAKARPRAAARPSDEGDEIDRLLAAIR